MAKNPDPSTVNGLCEIDLPWNGDFSLDETGDLFVAADTGAPPFADPAATTQRLIRLAMSCSGLNDVNGAPLGDADDIFHRGWGGSARAYVGDLFSPTGMQQLASNITAQVIQDPGVSASPPPVATVTFVSIYTYNLDIVWWDWNGNQHALPTIKLTPSGATLLSVTQ